MAVDYAEVCRRMRAVGEDPDRVFAAAPVMARRAVEAGQRPSGAIPLQRTVKWTRAEAAADTEPGDGYSIDGYASVFDSPTEIHSWEGSFTEVVDKGATKKSLREGLPKLQFDHGYHPLLGGLPLGRWDTGNEDDHGMYLAGRMRQNWLIEPFAEAIREQDVDGMSIRFSVVREKWVDKDGKEIKDDDELFELLYWGAGDRGPITRHLREIKVAEAGPVVWPAYKDTSVGARSDGAMVIDLAAMRAAPEHAGYAIAELDRALSAHAPTGGTPLGTDPATRWQPIGAAALQRMAADMTAHLSPDATRSVHTGAVATPPDAPGAATTTEPRPTGQTAAEHPDPNRSAPHGTDQEPAGQHSQSSQPSAERSPANPTERRTSIRARYRSVLDQTLVLPPST